jgi:hypothetical protein
LDVKNMPLDSLEQNERMIEVPSPTAWPVVLAVGLALIFAGLVTGPSITCLGAVIACTGAYGWFRNVLPVEAHESMAVLEETPVVTTARPEVARATLTQAPHRAVLPIEIYPVSAGIKGGLAGGAVMACLAVLYGIASGHGIWYPINLLAAGFLPESIGTEQLEAFQLSVFLIASTIHLLASLLVGLLYGAVLPMLPRRPVLLGGIIAPMFWSGLLYGILDIVNPMLNQRIDWFWFVLSQIGFGVVAGIIVARQERVAIAQRLPFEVRMGLEKTGLEERQ